MAKKNLLNNWLFEHPRVIAAYVGVTGGIAVTLFLGVLTAAAAMLYERGPYRWFDVVIPDVAYMTPEDIHLEVEVNLFRTRLCPYIIERTVFDSQNEKVYDTRLTFAAPRITGPETFGADIDLWHLPSEGTAVYSVRVGSMCNIMQRLWPNWTEWKDVPFEVVHGTPKSEYPYGPGLY